jgi:hypothetical protein
VERHDIGVASTPRCNRHRPIVDARTDISRGNRIALFPSMVSLQFIAAFFSMPEVRRAALERMNEQLRTPSEKSRAAICDAANDGHPCPAIKDKENI